MRKAGRRIVLAGLFAFIVYPLSYAPACVAVDFLDLPPTVFDFLDSGPYRPVVVLIDHTPLKRGLFWWSDVWGVEWLFSGRQNARLLGPQPGLGPVPLPDEPLDESVDSMPVAD